MPKTSHSEQPPREPAGSLPLEGERVAFTGTLASMTHQQAQRLVEEQGGAATAHVSRQTTMLVVGEEGWPLEPDGQPSQKLQLVKRWQREGMNVRLLNESDWLYLLGLEEQRREVNRLYTPAMLSRMLDVPLGIIRRWERLGLIRAVRKVYRLPYFDFREVAGVRRLSALLSAGVSRSEVEAGLHALRTVLPDVDRPLAQLDILARESHLLYRDSHGLLEPASGQRHFDFDPQPPDDDADSEDGLPIAAAGAGGPASKDSSIGRTDVRLHWKTPDWFREGCRLLEDNELTAAVEAFRICLMERPGDAEINFNLAEALYRAGRPEGALERYYAAVESDHNYLEAWTQLGCLHAQRGELNSALDAFRIALDLHADYADAHWHTADVLQQLGRGGEAVDHWRQYLKHDCRGPWAEQARQRLQEAGVETAPAGNRRFTATAADDRPDEPDPQTDGGH